VAETSVLAYWTIQHIIACIATGRGRSDSRRGDLASEAQQALC